MFYTYRQNNTFGTYADNMPVYLIVEADSPSEADGIAQANGVYFDGCNAAIDCPCCGDRWERTEAWDATAEPMIYDETPEEFFRERSGWGYKPEDVKVIRKA